MSYQSIVARLRSWNIEVEETPGCYGRNNGIGQWNAGIPDASLKHHFVCSLNPDDAYIRGLISMLVNGYGDTPGPIVNWFGDVNGKAWLIADLPANHCGRGDSSVLARIRNGNPPLGPAVDFANNNDYTGNAYYSGQELQHPGDSTPWPTKLLRVAIAVSAAECIEWGYSSTHVLDHYEHTNRKQDMSLMGGPASTDGANWFRAQVARWIAANGDPDNAPAQPPVTPTPPPVEKDDMFGDDDRKALTKAASARPASDLILFKHPSGGIGLADLWAHTWRGITLDEVDVFHQAGIPGYVGESTRDQVAARFGRQVS